MTSHLAHPDPRLYLRVFIALLVMLILTILAAHLRIWPFDVEWVKLSTALLIAAAKAMLVILYFMHVRYSTRLTWVFASAAFLWLGIIATLTYSDYLTRPWLPRLTPAQHIARDLTTPGHTSPNVPTK